jgi:hypothetical protein
MAIASGVLVEPAQGSPVRVSSRQRERLFFSGMVLALMVTVFWGFAPSFYLHGVLDSPNVLTPSLVVHGTVFSAWMVLLFVQTSLVAARRTDLHRRLGVAGAGLGVLMVVVGAYVTITRAGLPGAAPLAFLAIPLTTVVVFPALFGTALYFRRRTDIHKRLVLIATIELVAAAVARLPGVAPLGPYGVFGGADLLVRAIVVCDLVALQRVHPATLWGGAVLIASQAGRVMIGDTAAWQAFAAWLIG